MQVFPTMLYMTKCNYYLCHSLEGRVEWPSGYKIRTHKVMESACDTACFFSNKLSGRMRPCLISLLHSQCRARGVLAPFFQVVHQSWRILFSAFASVRYTRVRVLSHWICNENVLGNSALFPFFLATAFPLFSTRASVSTFFLWKGSNRQTF